ncbi:MAG: undecaprenyldiphospho-muramoylpentapeptide beta-N-acetylglucosaminyltransferase [Methylophilaceae bacterium]
MSPSRTLMVMAGGTGGHVFPAIAVADWLKAKGWNIAWLVTEGGMENQLIATKGYASSMIKMKGVRGKGMMRKLAAPFQVLFACKQSLQAIRLHQPDVVLGMGGFAAFPGGLMAWLLRKPLVIHEQNSVAGLTNRALSYFAKRVLAAFPSAFGEKATLVGNPVRADITALPAPTERFANRQGALRILVIGGSLGAQILNETVPQALAQLPLDNRPEIIHQAGVKHIEQLQSYYKEANVSADTRAFIDDMATMYGWCDVVICRAGALTIAELAAAGVASILVPFPHAVDDHQTGNARYLAEDGAALLITQHTLNAASLAQVLTSLTREKLLAMAMKARALGKPEATADVAQICMGLAT